MLRFTKLDASGGVQDIENPLHMNFLGGMIGSLIGGNEAADAEADAIRAGIEEARGLREEEAGYIKPYLGTAERARSAWEDLLFSPGELDPVSSEIARRNQSSLYNMLRARGMGGSGTGWQRLLSMGLNDQLGLRRNRLSELLGGVSVGQNASGLLGNANSRFLSVLAPGQEAIGAAKGAGQANMWSNIGGIADLAGDVAMGGTPFKNIFA